MLEYKCIKNVCNKISIISVISALNYNQKHVRL